ncbi:MAG: hypothetical protein ABS904_00260 [Solibacillus isronensis]
MDNLQKYIEQYNHYNTDNQHHWMLIATVVTIAIIIVVMLLLILTVGKVPLTALNTVLVAVLLLTVYSITNYAIVTYHDNQRHNATLGIMRELQKNSQEVVTKASDYKVTTCAEFNDCISLVHTKDKDNTIKASSKILKHINNDKDLVLLIPSIEDSYKSQLIDMGLENLIHKSVAIKQ